MDDEQVRRRGLDRVNNFSDAVVAIAATLLILPLVDAAAAIGDRSVGAFLSDIRQQIFVFVLSFVVVYRFWTIHHTTYSRLIDYSRPLMLVNSVWLLSIVFLPFPTEILGLANIIDRPTTALYVGTLLVTAATGMLAQWISVRDPSLLTAQARQDTQLVASAVATGLMLVALIVAVTVPVIGLYALLLLFLANPVERLLPARMRDTKP